MSDEYVKIKKSAWDDRKKKYYQNGLNEGYNAGYSQGLDEGYENATKWHDEEGFFPNEGEMVVVCYRNDDGNIEYAFAECWIDDDCQEHWVGIESEVIAWQSFELYEE